MLAENADIRFRMFEFSASTYSFPLARTGYGRSGTVRCT